MLMSSVTLAQTADVVSLTIGLAGDRRMGKLHQCAGRECYPALSPALQTSSWLILQAYMELA